MESRFFLQFIIYKDTKTKKDDTIQIKYYELKLFQSDGESSREPLVKGADDQLILFPQISLHPGLAFNPSTPWAGRLAHQPPGFWNNGTWRLASISPHGLGYL